MKFSGKLIFIMAMIIISIFFSVLVASAEEDPHAALKLNAVIEVTEYARLKPYSGELNVSAIHSASNEEEIIAAVTVIKKFIDDEAEAAALEGTAFDEAVNALLPVSSLDFEDFDSVRELRETYEALSTDSKHSVTKLDKLIELEAKSNDLASDQFLTLQSALPSSVTVLTQGILDQTLFLREFFDHYMLFGASELVDESHFLEIEQDVLALKKIQDDILSAAAVDEMINAFPEILTLSNEDEVDEARIAYDALTIEAKALVTLFDELISAEAAISALNIYFDSAAAFDALVAAFPEIISYENLEEINAARTVYNAMPQEAKIFATRYAALLNAEMQFAELKESKIIGDEIKAFIEALGEIHLGLEPRIINIRARYEELTEDAKAFVTNYQDLTDAEARISELKSALSAAEVFQPRIDEIATIVSMADEEDETSILNAGRAIAEIKDDYDVLSADIKLFIVNSEAIETGLAEINSMKDAFDAGFVVALIDGISEPVVIEDTPVIESARLAYDTLTEGAKHNIINYQKLLNAEAAIYVIENGEYDAAAVDALIEALPEPITLEDQTEVILARIAYLTLSAYEQALVDSDALNALSDAEAVIELLTGYYYNAMEVNLLIAAFGTITLGKADRVTAAREAYQSLTEQERIYITDYQALVSAELRLAELVSAETAADVVIGLIAALSVPVELSDKEAVAEARTEFNSLTIDAKSYVTNYSALLEAENTIIVLELAEAAGDVSELIASIPLIIELNEECINQIYSARTAYDNLNDDAKSTVTGFNLLIEAESELNLLIILETARALSVLIDGLPGVSDIALTDEAAIVELRAAYEILSIEGKAAVENIGDLVLRETRLAELLRNSLSAENFDAAVLALGAVENIDITKTVAVQTVRSSYDALNDEAKGFVTQYSLFLTIEARLESETLRVNAEVNAVESDIAAIPEISNLALRDTATVAAARSAYDALEQSAKPLVIHYEVLINAELQIYRLTKYNDFNTSVSRIDYRDYEWSRILILAEDFIEELFASSDYEEMDGAFDELMENIGALPTALDHNKSQAKEDIIRYAASIGYEDEIDFATIDAALNVYEISEAADVISDFIGEARQAQIDAAIEQATYDIGNHITNKVNEYLDYMQIEPTGEFDITAPEATYTEFRGYLAQAYGEEAIDVIILLHKKAVIQMMFAEDEETMIVIRDECIDAFDEITTLSDDRDSYQLEAAKQQATAALAEYIDVENKRKYTDENWAMLELKISGALAEIAAAASLEQVETLLAVAEQDIAAIEQGNYNWIIILIALVLGLSTAGVITVFALVIKQQRKLRFKRLINRKK